MNNEYKKLCVLLKEIAEKEDIEELKKINDHYKKNNKAFKNMEEAREYSNELIKQFNLDYPKSKEEKEKAMAIAKENIINEYEEVIDSITINIITMRDKEFKPPIIDDESNIKIPSPDIIYRTWITLSDEEHIYDNILLKILPNEEESKQYFETLLNIIKDSNIDTISKKIIKMLEK